MATVIAPKDLADATSASGTPAGVVGQCLNCSSSGAAITSPTLPGSVGTPPARWAVRNTSAGSQTVTYPSDITGSSATITLLAGEVLTFRQKSTTGWGAESGNKPLTALAAYLAPTYHNVGNSGSAVTLPVLVASVGDTYDVTLNAATPTLTLPTPAAGQSFVLRLTQDGTGSRVPTFAVTGGSTVKWSQAVAPVLSTVGGKADVLVFQSISGSAWTGGLFALDVR